MRSPQERTNIGPDHKVIDMKALYATLVQTLTDAHPAGTMHTENTPKLDRLVSAGLPIVRLREFGLQAKYVSLLSEPCPNFWTRTGVLSDLLKAGCTLAPLASLYIHTPRKPHPG